MYIYEYNNISSGFWHSYIINSLDVIMFLNNSNIIYFIKKSISLGFIEVPISFVEKKTKQAH